MGSAVAALLIQTGVIAAVHITGQTPLSVFELQTFLIALMIVGLFLGATVDEREQAELALRKSQKLVAAGQMAAALTHELSQPLTALANYARAGQLLVVAGERDQLRLEDTMQKLVVESRRTADVVRRLRDFLQHGTMRMAPTNLSALCREVMESMRETATASGITLRDDVAEGMPEIWADALQIEIVVRNLLRNAIDAAREAPAGNRHITMKITATADSIRLAVMDSGSGVPRGQAEHIFEPFETSKASGMGMGLAVSRAIVEAHQGHLWAESGEYGIFCLALPIKENEHG
jgi:signal transduction histidine kinase